MKTFKIILFSFFGVLFAGAISGYFFIKDIRNSAAPQYKGEISIQGLGSEVVVYRDDRGMPHIYAGNEYDLYFSVGYITAQERLWQMDLIRRATTGRLAEVLGGDLVKTDHFLRTLDMTTKSKMILSTEDSVVIECMRAYTDGVNAYISAAGKKLPPEFRILNYKPEQWKLEDIANIIGYMGWDLAAGNLTADIFNYKMFQKLGYEKGSSLIPDFKAVESSVFPGFRLNASALKEAQEFISSSDKLTGLGITSFSGSNNWAVSGSKSETGKPIFSNDMHLGLSSPGIWMQMHQVIPGKLNVTGVLVPGEPFIVAGHNEKIAWGMTNLMVDDIDLFDETINPYNTDQYYFRNEWKNMLVKEEIIKIKGGDADTFRIRFTHRGPIVSGFREVNDAALSMRWSGYDESDELKGVYLLNRASGWEEFRTALSSFGSVSQNFAYADTEGNIGINTGGGIPVRQGHGSIIRNGETDDSDWKGYVPFGQLPSSFNPDNGYISSANNKTVSDDYPYYISYLFYPPYRIGRIRQMLEEKEKYGIEDFKAMITDQHSFYAGMLTPHILKITLGQQEMSRAEQAAMNLLKEWDYEMNANSAAPSIFEFFRKSLSKNLLADELEELFVQMPERISDYYIYKILKTGQDEWVDDVTTPQAESLEDIIKKSYSDCIKKLTEDYGEDLSDWTWGKIHKITLEHPIGKVKILDKAFGLNSDNYSIGGSNHTVCPYSYVDGFRVTDGASERHIYNTANWDESYTVIPTGASGVPSSEFYLSQTKTYLDGKFYKDSFSEGAVKASAKYTLMLMPAN